MKKVSIYDNDNFIAALILNATEAREFVNDILIGTNYDVVITNQED